MSLESLKFCHAFGWGAGLAFLIGGGISGCIQPGTRATMITLIILGVIAMNLGFCAGPVGRKREQQEAQKIKA